MIAKTTKAQLFEPKGHGTQLVFGWILPANPCVEKALIKARKIESNINKHN